jgi:glycosyltransferase involved in cell wall biosynthesis
VHTSPRAPPRRYAADPVPTVSVIVPARDAAATLPALLDALAAQERPPDEVIVVDDGSTDATPEIAGRHRVVTTVVPGGGDGPGAARNLGVARSTGEVLAFTDADCAPTPRWLAAALAAFDDGADLVQGAVTPPPDARLGPWDRTVWVTHHFGLFETANLLVRSEVFHRAGGFEPWLSPSRSKELGEDVWLGWRAVRVGARSAFVPDALVHHAVFERDARAFVAERLRLRYFPEMARRVPELREAFFHRRLFLTPRSAAFDLALASVTVAAVRRRPLALAGVLPYARLLAADARTRGPRRTAVHAVADAVGFGALAAGTVAARCTVI